MRVHCLDLPALLAREAELPTADSFFASTGFAQLWALLGGRVRYWAVLEDGAIAAVLPSVEFGTGPLRRLQSMPDGCYGGVYVAKGAPAQASAYAELILRAIFRERWWRVHLVDYHATLAPNSMRPIACETQLVDIRDPDWWPQDTRLRRDIRSAQRQGILVERFDWQRHGSAYMRLAESTAARQGRSVLYPMEFYAGLARLAEHDARVHWSWFEREGEPACSHVYIREGDILLSWQLEFDKRFSAQKPNQYIRWLACRELATRGCTHVNLGATPEGAVSLTHYKSKWGGEPHRYPTWVRQSLFSRVLHR